MEYVVFSDESYISAERYRSIGALSFNRKYYEELNSNLSDILKDSSVKELKWNKLKNAKHKLCSKKILGYLLPQVQSTNLRLDVIIWDTHDSRHSVQRRDDTDNFGRMFFHLLKSLMTKREKGSTWHVRPDKRLEIDWDTINDCLQNVGQWKELFASPLFGGTFSENNYYIKTFKQIDSHAYPCCQVADLFAGISVFSINQYSKYCQWHNTTSKQLQLLTDNKVDSFSNKELCRFEILKELIDYCKMNHLGVSLKSRKRLYTPNPKNPINFWPYEPQHPYDKAPVKATKNDGT